MLYSHVATRRRDLERFYPNNSKEGEYTPKIIDFGYCTVEKVPNRPKMFYNVGSPRYMSPEAYTGNRYS